MKEDGQRMDLDVLQSAVARWADYNFPNHLPHQSLLGMMEELGELAHSHLKMEQGIRGSVDKHRRAAADALGDLAIYMAHYCHKNGYNLKGAVADAWEIVSKRDWVNYPENGGVKDDNIGKHREG